MPSGPLSDLPWVTVQKLAALAGIESIAMTNWRHLPAQKSKAMSDQESMEVLLCTASPVMLLRGNLRHNISNMWKDFLAAV
eukprot:Skav210344  [mRNA]  locus=scaffold4443:152539:152781:+ [translate_table: standard]